MSASIEDWKRRQPGRARLTADDLLKEANRQLDERLEKTRVIVVPQLR